MFELLENAKEFIDSGDENILKNRFNPAVSDFFKSIVILCDYLIYNEIKIIPKNHNERFNLLEKYFSKIYLEVSSLFDTYIKSYNLRMNKKEASVLRNYSYELWNSINKK
jgi:hypothetical protein